MTNSPPRAKKTPKNRASFTQDEAQPRGTARNTPTTIRAPRSARLKNPTSTVGHFRKAAAQTPAGVGERLKNAIREARKMQSVLKAGDEDALASTMLLQGILSGDVMAASFHVRQRLQRENLRLRRRLNMARIKTETAKVRLLEIEATARSRPASSPFELMNHIREIYGLPPVHQPLLPQSTITAEVISEP